MILLLLLAASVAPRAHYLDAPTVRAALWGLDWEPCAGEDAGPTPLALRIAPDGRVHDLRVEGPLRACAEAVLGVARFPAHDEASVEVRTTLVVRAGRVQPWPTLSLEQHRASRLFLLMVGEGPSGG